MEEFQTCPICTNVPEKEIFQCSSGHLICHLCLPKVVGNRCPQCRITFGPTKIRSRVCERMLDTQRFECKFKNRGCTHSTPRGEITSHANSCSYNPKNTLALCEQLGIGTCNNFRLGFASRKQIIYHFKEVHGVILKTATESTVPGFSIPVKEAMEMKEAGSEMMQRSVLFGLITPKHSETSPLFLVLGKFSDTVKYFSFLAVNLWALGTQPKKFNAVFTLNKLEKPQSFLDLASSGSSSTPTNHMEVFPISGSMRVCSVEEARHLFNECPVNFRMSLLQRSQFGSCSGDKIHVKITEMKVPSYAPQL